MSDKKENENEIEKDDKSKSKPDITPKKEFSKKVGNYILSEQIGIGTFSKVVIAIHILTGEKVAVKILDKSKIKDNIDIERISREIEILKSISHPNISQLYESNSTIHNFYLIMEYIDGGDLCDYINQNICLNEHLACHFFRQLISVIEYLNEMGITHRDIKPENILLDSSKKNIKVIDFGLSNYCADQELLESACGSPCFASPEMLSGNPYNGITTDIWSSGIVLYSMLIGTLPFDDQELTSLYEQIKIGTFYIPSTLSLEAIDFLKKILRVEPEKRLNIQQIKEHPWFNLEKNKMYKGIDLTVETFPYDENLIQYVIDKFFEDDNDINKETFIKMVQYHACNQYTATYYLTKLLLKNKKSLKENNSNNNIENTFFSSRNSLATKNDEKSEKKNENKKESNNYNKTKKVESVKDNNDIIINIENNSFKTQKNKKSFNMKDSKEKNNNSKSNSTSNKYKSKNIINKNNYSKENTKITIIKKDLIFNKKSPRYSKKKKNSFANNKKLNLYPDDIVLDNKKNTFRINTILDCIKNFKISENNSKCKKTKSWQKKEKDRYLIRKIKKEKNKYKIVLDKNKITRNHFTAYNFITEYPKKFDNSQSTNKIDNIRFGGSFMKKNNMSLTDRGNSIFGEEQKVLSYNNSKMQSIKAEKIKKDKINLSAKKRKISNNIKTKKKYDNNSMNISKNNFLIKKEKHINKYGKNKIIDLNIISKEKNKKYPKIINKYNKKKIYINTNSNSEFKKLKTYNNTYILTENNHYRKDSKLNKFNFYDGNNSLLHMKKIYFKNKKIKSHNNTINKYKELIKEYNTGIYENKKNKIKKVISKLEIENEYFNSVIQKYDQKTKIKNRNKNNLLINPSNNHSISKTKTLNNNNISNSNINALSQNYTNNKEEIKKIESNLMKNSIKNKDEKNHKLFQSYKYKKNNLKINLGYINSNINRNKNNNMLGFLCNKLKNKKNINKAHRKNTSNKINCSSFMKTSTNKKIKNPFSQNISVSPEGNNNNIKNTDNNNNKKIINININNILKINKKYSISLTKSNDSFKHSNINSNNIDNIEQKNLVGMKNYNSNYPLVIDKNNYRGAIKYFSNYYGSKNKNEIIYPKMRNQQKNNKNYSSMLKRQLLEEHLINKNKNI